MILNKNTFVLLLFLLSKCLGLRHFGFNFDRRINQLLSSFPQCHKTFHNTRILSSTQSNDISSKKKFKKSDNQKDALNIINDDYNQEARIIFEDLRGKRSFVSVDDFKKVNTIKKIVRRTDFDDETFQIFLEEINCKNNQLCVDKFTKLYIMLREYEEAMLGGKDVDDDGVHESKNSDTVFNDVNLDDASIPEGGDGDSDLMYLNELYDSLRGQVFFIAICLYKASILKYNAIARLRIFMSSNSY
jgi:hypothetical protein